MPCDVLAELKREAQDMGISGLPGLVYKFLAKGIMSRNNAWKYDVFANGKSQGWETWLSIKLLKRNERGAEHSIIFPRLSGL
ncbi:hypothetical protein N7507_007107 [Penicillium longicatenatum]|nr:hypothetical protein N7507_007107 [Penicillium longicatenatum]